MGSPTTVADPTNVAKITIRFHVNGVSGGVGAAAPVYVPQNYYLIQLKHILVVVSVSIFNTPQKMYKLVVIMLSSCLSYDVI